MTFKQFFTESKNKPKNFCYMVYTSAPYSDYLEDIQNDLDIDGDRTKKDKFHCTIRYVKTDKSPQILIDYLDSMEKLPVLSATTKSMDIYGDDRCVVLELSSQPMHNWFHKIDNFLKKNDYPPSDYPDYKPHVTITEESKLDDAPEFDKDKHKLKIDFDRHIITDENYNVIYERVAK